MTPSHPCLRNLLIAASNCWSDICFEDFPGEGVAACGAAVEPDDEDPTADVDAVAVGLAALDCATCETESSGATEGVAGSSAALSSEAAGMPASNSLKVSLSSNNWVRLTSIRGLTSGGLHNIAPLKDQFVSMYQLRLTW